MLLVLSRPHDAQCVGLNLAGIALSTTDTLGTTSIHIVTLGILR